MPPEPESENAPRGGLASPAIPEAVRRQAPPDFDKNIRRLFWIYFLLLLFEGSIRKWLVPSALSTPLAIIRDPILLYTYWLAFRGGRLPTSPFVVSCGILALLSFPAGLIPDQNTVFVDLYGVRTNFLHMPLIFLLPRLFNSKDVLAIGKWCLIIVIPLSFLIADQFLSSPTSWINKASTDEAAQIGGGEGRVRPPGIFTFATGMAEFSALCSVFLIYGTLFPRTYPRWLLVGGGLGLATCMALSISRLNVTSVSVVVLCLLIFNAMRPGFFPRFIPFAILGTIALLSLSQLKPIQTGLAAFSTRINDASAFEGGQQGFLRRVTSAFTAAFSEKMWKGSLEGYGLGMGTNAGARLLTGKTSYLLAEGEWERITLESGPILGTCFLLWRVALVLWLLRRSFSFAYHARPLPLLLFGAALPLVLIGQLGRPTTLGFTVFDSGLCVAAMNAAEAMKMRPVRPSGRRYFRPPADCPARASTAWRFRQ